MKQDHSSVAGASPTTLCLGATPSTDYCARDGKVFIRGIFHGEDECARLLAVFRLSATAGDWFAPFAADLANQLEAAIADAAWQQHQQEAA